MHFVLYTLIANLFKLLLKLICKFCIDNFKSLFQEEIKAVLKYTYFTYHFCFLLLLDYATYVKSLLNCIINRNLEICKF